MSDSKQVVVFGGFDDIRSRDLRFLEEAAKLGAVTVLVWPDDLTEQATGAPPKFPLAERDYFLNAVRYVNRVVQFGGHNDPDSLPEIPGFRAHTWADMESRASPARGIFCREHGICYRVFKMDELKGFPEPLSSSSAPRGKKVIVSGSYDWLHSGHIRFLEEAKKTGGLGARLIVIVASDETVTRLKGRPPVIPDNQRRALVEALKVVDEAVIGFRDLDMEKVLTRVKPDIVAVGHDQGEIEDEVKRVTMQKRLKIRVERIGRFGPNDLNSSSKIKRRIVEGLGKRP